MGASMERGPSNASVAVALSVREVSLRYGTRSALNAVSVELRDGVTALVGVNGAGKTSLLRVAAGALPPVAGEVALYGADPYGRRSRRRALSRVALMPQTTTFPGAMTALDVVSYLAWMRGEKGRAARSLAVTALECVGLGADRANSKIKELSGGMVRRVALAQAIATNPEVLLLDEPSTGLDPQQRRMMVELIGSLDGCVLLSSHVMEDVVDVADRVLVLHEGAIVFDGSVAELQALAPADTVAGKHAEAGFLRVISSPVGTGSG